MFEKKILELRECSKKLLDTQEKGFGWKSETICSGNMDVWLYFSHEDNRAHQAVHYEMKNPKRGIQIAFHKTPAISFEIGTNARDIDHCIERAKNLIGIINKRERDV